MHLLVCWHFGTRYAFIRTERRLVGGENRTRCGQTNITVFSHRCGRSLAQRGELRPLAFQVGGITDGPGVESTGGSGSTGVCRSGCRWVEMWTLTLMLLSQAAAQGSLTGVKVECRVSNDFPTSNSISPSLLADLKAELVTGGEKHNCMINISWAINIDASIKYLTGTRIRGSLESVYLCEYNPPLVKSNLTGSQQMWFNFLVKARYGSNVIQAANLPLPLSVREPSYKVTSIMIPRSSPCFPPKPTQFPTIQITSGRHTTVNADPKKVPAIKVVTILGGLASVMILSFCFIIFKMCGANLATSLGFKRLPSASIVPVPVLLVYPPGSSAFQWALTALAEFLQWHGGCSVAVDMWQQRKIAELGPMRWLAEQSKAAERVLIVCPKEENPNHSPPTLPGPSVPAAACDLYPLILNMVAGHAKSASELSKFWVVLLGEQHDNRPNNLPPELKACKKFWLMKDLNRLCRNLYTQRHDDKNRGSYQIFRLGLAYNGNSTVNLREAVNKLNGLQPACDV